MARVGAGWVNTTRNENISDFWSSNVLRRPVRVAKVQSLPPLNIHYEKSPSTNDKEWTDQALLSTRSINSYLAESDAFQRASFANIVEKWKEYERHKADQMISSFDAHYNMKLRFRQDEKLNRASEMKYGTTATYYRFLGDEHNSKNALPCNRHKRLTKEFEARHIRDLLHLPPNGSRSKPYSVSNIGQLTPIERTAPVTPVPPLSTSLIEKSHHSFA